MDFVDLILLLFLLYKKNMFLYRGGPSLVIFFNMKQLMQLPFRLHITSATLSTTTYMPNML